MQQNEEDIEQYEEELKEIDEHYQDQLNHLAQEEIENRTLNQTVTRHQSIQKLQSIVDRNSSLW